ncbi:MAG TPA: aminotransferase class IV [Solirubrobacterales bacterium]|nr:aminotransferase class IV [Solirubrobacterales bacterium]
MAAPWRPDPSKGVFETLLVLDGRPVELEAHLSRLDESLSKVFPTLRRPRIALEAPLEGDAVRIDVAPRGARLEARVSMREIEHHGRGSLCSLRLAGGLGPHKWADRSLLNEAQAALPDDALPLIVDEDGTALEASRANVFAVRDGVLVTPPLDGRILPGVTRMRVLRIAEALGIESREEPLSRDDLLAADEAFLTGSLRGVEPAGSLDGHPVPGGGPIAERLAAELRRAWTGLGTAASFGDRLARPHAAAGLRTRQDGKTAQQSCADLYP